MSTLKTSNDNKQAPDILQSKEVKLKYNPNVNNLTLPFQIVVFILYLFVLAIYELIQKQIVWRLTGTRRLYADSVRPENYQVSAHVFNIIGRFKLDLGLGPAEGNNFVLTHIGFKHPDCVLKDNVTLYVADATQAIFVEMDEGVQVWRRDYGSFLRLAQFEHAKRVIIMPRHSFDRLAEQVGDPKADLIFLSNTARCGGTLVGQIFEGTDRCVMYCEPDCLNAVVTFAETMPEKEVKLLGVNVVRMLCKPVKKPSKVIAFVFKPTAGAVDSAPFFGRLFPKCKHLFVYRDPFQMSPSLVKISYKLPLLRLLFFIGSISPRMNQLAMQLMRFGKKDFYFRIANPLELGIRVWCISGNKYLNLRAEGVRIGGVIYDDLVADKRFAITEIFRFCGLEDGLIEAGIRALDYDSQEHSYISRRIIKHIKVPDFTPEVKAQCEKIMEGYGFPKEKGYVLDGTITHKY